MDNKTRVAHLNSLPETMLIPLFLKAKETMEGGIILDNKAVEIIKNIEYDFSRMKNNWLGQISVCTNTYLIDSILTDLAKSNSDLVVVNLGAGLDTRQVRFPNLKWYELDLPESIDLRKQFFSQGKTKYISKSVLDFSWFNDIDEKENVLFIAEGLFMYFDPKEIKELISSISGNFVNSFLAFDLVHKSLVGSHRQTKSTDANKAIIKFGVSSVKDIENWKSGWSVYRTYFKLDYFKKRWRYLRLLSLLSPFKKGLIIAVLKTKNKINEQGY